MRRGVSNAMWVVVALVVALAVALLLLTIAGKNINKSGKQGGDIIDTSGSAVNAQICKDLCESCKKQYGKAECLTTWWATVGGSCTSCS